VLADILRESIAKLRRGMPLDPVALVLLLERLCRIPASYAQQIDELNTKLAEVTRDLANSPLAGYTQLSYWECVRSCAQDLLEDEDENQHSGASIAENTSWCIYYVGQKAVLLYTQSEDAWQDMCEELPKDNVLGVIAICAMGQDIEDHAAELRGALKAQEDADEDEGTEEDEAEEDKESCD
jgi:hypothetical protein